MPAARRSKIQVRPQPIAPSLGDTRYFEPTAVGTPLRSVRRYEIWDGTRWVAKHEIEYLNSVIATRLVDQSDLVEK